MHAAPLGSETNQETSTESPVDPDLLEKQATNYVMKYIENTYLYESNDLSKGTILAAYAKTAAIPGWM